MSDTTASSKAEQPDHCIMAEGGKEYLFSRCSHCTSLHRRQEIIRTRGNDIALWKSAEEQSTWEMVLGFYKMLCLALFFLPFAETDKFSAGYIALIWIACWAGMVVVGIIGFRSEMVVSRRRDAIRMQILDRYGEYDVDKVGLVSDLKDSDWEEDPDEELEFALIAQGEQV